MFVAFNRKYPLIHPLYTEILELVFMNFLEKIRKMHKIEIENLKHHS